VVVKRKRLLSVFIAFVGVLLTAWFFFAGPLSPFHTQDDSTERLRVLAYSSFVNSWGPGPEIAKLFREKTGVSVEYYDADDAGLLLRQLKLRPADVVLGFDQLMFDEARQDFEWRTDWSNSETQSLPFLELEFLPFDWGPLAFVYRDGEITPPARLEDLLDQQFEETVTLPDPRTSSPGLQFLYWVLDQKGVELGFEFLRALKKSIHTVGSSWSITYGIFQKGQAKLGLSYFTSPIYHLTQENNPKYRVAIFYDGHPVQVEYAGVPASCEKCDRAIEFLQFLIEPEIQKIIMQKNYMLPVVDSVVEGTPFDDLPDFKIRPLKTLPELQKRRVELLKRWKELGL